MSIIKLAAALAIMPFAASGGQVSTTQNFDAAGDFALGAFSDNFLPTFDTTLGTLTGVSVALAGSLSWGEDIVVDQPDDDASTFPVLAGVALSDPTDSILTEIDAPAATWTAIGSTPGFEQTVALAGAISIDPALFSDAANPEDLIIAPFGLVDQGSCTGFCDDVFSDDSEGEISGTLTNTFTFTPAADSVPEPWSVALLGAGLIGVVAARRFI